MDSPGGSMILVPDTDGLCAGSGSPSGGTKTEKNSESKSQLLQESRVSKNLNVVQSFDAFGGRAGSTYVSSPVSSFVFSSSNQKNNQRFGPRYHRLTFITFLCGFSFLLAVESVTLFLSLKAFPDDLSFVSELRVKKVEIEMDIKTFTKQLTEGKTPALKLAAIRTMQASAAETLRWYSGQKDKSNKVMVYQCVASAIHILIFFAVLFFTYRYRNHPAVKSRSVPFLVHLFISTALLQIVAVMIIYASTLQTLPYPPLNRKVDLGWLKYMEEKAGKTEALYFSMVAASLYCLAFFANAIVQRQRIICLIFIDPFATQKNPGWQYYTLLPLFLIMGTTSCIPVWIEVYAKKLEDKEWTSNYFFAGAWATLITYGSLWVYYNLRTKQADLMFSDYHANIRSVIVLQGMFAGMMIFAHFHFYGPSTIYLSVVVTRLPSSSYVLDQFWCQVVQARLFSAEKSQRTNVATIFTGTVATSSH